MNDAGNQDLVGASHIVEIESLAIGAGGRWQGDSAGYGAQRIRYVDRVVVAGIEIPGHSSGESDLVEKGELLNGLGCRHIGVTVGGLRMGHRLERVNAGYIIISQYVLLQERGHKQRPLQALTGEVGRGCTDVSGSLITQIPADHEDQVDILGAQRSLNR